MSILNLRRFTAAPLAAILLALACREKAATRLEKVYPAIQHEVEVGTSLRAERRASNNMLHLSKRSEERLEHHYLRGGVLMLNAETGRLDPTQAELPAAMRASTPGEVGAIVLLRWTVAKVGTYVAPGSVSSAGGSGAYQRSCDLRVVDVKARTEVGFSRQLWGPAPPPTSSGPASGPWPTAEVVASVVELPRVPLDFGLDETADEWRLELGQEPVGLDLPSLGWGDLQGDGPFLVQLPRESLPIEVLPDGTFARGGRTVAPAGGIPAGRIFFRTGERALAVRLTIRVPFVRHSS